MKNLPIFTVAILLASGLLFGTPSDLELGHSRKDVIHRLGNPIGILEVSGKTILMYPEGEVTLLGDKVSAIKLLSESEFAAEQERKRIEREEWLIQQEQLSAARKQEGEQIKNAKLQSSAFVNLPAKQRVDYWRSFQARYPEVDVAEQITRALEIHQAELAERATERRIDALEARVLKAEEALAAALDENERLRGQLNNRNYVLSTPYYNNARFYKNYYPNNRVIIRTGGDSSARHPEHCPDAGKYDRSQAREHRTYESTAERAARILNSVRER